MAADCEFRLESELACSEYVEHNSAVARLCAFDDSYVNESANAPGRTDRFQLTFRIRAYSRVLAREQTVSTFRTSRDELVDDTGLITPTAFTIDQGCR